MRRIFAIASISMRTALRSKVVLTMLVLLVLVILGIPSTIKGDGTLAGYIRILLDYTLNFVLAILAISTIWAGCAAISQEVDNKRIQMVVAKPVHTAEIWVGKWLGLMIPTFFLVLFSGAVVYGILMWNVRPSKLTAEEQQLLRKDLLVGRLEIEPREPEGLGERIENMLDQARKNDRLPQDVPESEVRKMLRRNLIRKKQTCKPGSSCEWMFELPELPEDRPVSLVFHASSSSIGGVSLPGRISVARANGEDLFEKELEISTEQQNQLGIPVEQLGGHRKLLVEFENLSENETAIFPPEDNVHMLGYGGSFELNYLRTILIIFCQLALLAAIAITMGALFSTPVAAFTSIFALLLVFMSGYIHRMAQRTDYSFNTHHHGAQTEVEEYPGIIDTTVHYIFIVADHAVAPLREENALELCSTGRYVSWRMLGRVFFYRVIVYTGIIGFLGVWVFSRRELALPQR